MNSWRTIGFSPADEQRFERLFRQHWDWAVSWASRIQGIDAELIASRAMQKALVRFDPAKGRFRALLRRILFCERASAYRREFRHLRRECVLPDEDDLPDEAFSRESERAELAEELAYALSQLPPADRRLLELHFYENLTYEQIASQSGALAPASSRGDSEIAGASRPPTVATDP